MNKEAILCDRWIQNKEHHPPLCECVLRSPGEGPFLRDSLVRLFPGACWHLRLTRHWRNPGSLHPGGEGVYSMPFRCHLPASCRYPSPLQPDEKFHIIVPLPGQSQQLLPPQWCCRAAAMPLMHFASLDGRLQ